MDKEKVLDATPLRPFHFGILCSAVAAESGKLTGTDVIVKENIFTSSQTCCPDIPHQIKCNRKDFRKIFT
jgi:hypothetical protein